MRKTILYLAISVDGFIADKGGGVAWLTGDDPQPPENKSYCTLMETVDTVIMGGVTYRQITRELSPHAWPYQGLHSYVYTRQPQTPQPGITFFGGDLPAFVAQLKTLPGKDIWICGGAQLAQLLIQAKLIDRYHITLVPLLLGGGIPLFKNLPAPLPLQLLHTQRENGMVELLYKPRGDR